MIKITKARYDVFSFYNKQVLQERNVEAVALLIYSEDWTSIFQRFTTALKGTFPRKIKVHYLIVLLNLKLHWNFHRKIQSSFWFIAPARCIFVGHEIQAM